MRKYLIGAIALVVLEGVGAVGGALASGSGISFRKDRSFTNTSSGDTASKSYGSRPSPRGVHFRQSGA